MVASTTEPPVADMTRPETHRNDSIKPPPPVPGMSSQNSTSQSTLEKVPDEQQQQHHDNHHEQNGTTVQDDYPDGPPRLPYNLREHKLMIGLFWFLIFAESTLIPIVFYFTISNLTDMRPGAMFAIITAMFGFISGGEYGLRGLRLAQKSAEYRPLFGAGRWHFDSTQLILGKPYFVMTALMIGFSIPDPPLIRGLSIIMPVGILMLNLVMVATGVAHHCRWTLRWHRLSSHVRGQRVPPLTFCILEDITACDGGGGKAFREAALARYNASPRFRRLLVELLWAWSITGIVLNTVLVALAWTLPEEVAYAIGWTVPSVWGIVGAWMTIKYCQRSVRVERERWVEDRAARLSA